MRRVPANKRLTDALAKSFASFETLRLGQVAAFTMPTKKDIPVAKSAELKEGFPTPAIEDTKLRHSYVIGPGEKGVLTFEPYKSILLPHWRFKTVPIAQESAATLWDAFISYHERGDFVGMDMTRKFIQMGMTRAKRYANHKGGKKYGNDGEVLPKWEGKDVEGKRKEKEEASEVFKGYWQICRSHEGYAKLKEEWAEEKKDAKKAAAT